MFFLKLCCSCYFRYLVLAVENSYFTKLDVSLF